MAPAPCDQGACSPPYPPEASSPKVPELPFCPWASSFAVFSSFLCYLKWPIMIPFLSLFFSCFIRFLYKPNPPKASVPPPGKWLPEHPLRPDFSCFPRPCECLLRPKQGGLGAVTEFLNLDSPFLLLLEAAATMLTTFHLCSHALLLEWKSIETFLGNS